MCYFLLPIARKVMDTAENTPKMTMIVSGMKFIIQKGTLISKVMNEEVANASLPLHPELLNVRKAVTNMAKHTSQPIHPPVKVLVMLNSPLIPGVMFVRLYILHLVFESCTDYSENYQDNYNSSNHSYKPVRDIYSILP